MAREVTYPTPGEILPRLSRLRICSTSLLELRRQRRTRDTASLFSHRMGREIRRRSDVAAPMGASLPALRLSAGTTRIAYNSTESRKAAVSNSPSKYGGKRIRFPYIMSRYLTRNELAELVGCKPTSLACNHSLPLA